VHAGGYAFSAPAGWIVEQTPQGATAAPAKGSDTLVSVTVFGLVRSFRPALWPRAVGELDQVADRLAGQLSGRMESRATPATGVRDYTLSYERKGVKLRQRIRFLLRGRREYELLCRWQAGDGQPAACDLLQKSFRLS
jgi:hypothetical protein